MKSDAEEERRENELKPLLALALGLKSSEGFLLARHLTKQLEVNPFLRLSILFLPRIYVPETKEIFNRLPTRSQLQCLYSSKS